MRPVGFIDLIVFVDRIWVKYESFLLSSIAFLGVDLRVPILQMQEYGKSRLLFSINSGLFEWIVIRLR